MLRRAFTYGIFAFLFCVAGCGSGNDVNTQYSQTKDLVHSAKARNLALFFTAPRPVNNTPVYIDNDPERILASLTTLEQNFHSFKNEAATARTVSSMIREKLASDHISDDGTLFLYIGGHGAPNASAQMSDGSFVSLRTITDAVRAARPGKPIKRLVLMVFGCYSGSWINQIRGADLSAVAEELFVLTSSAANQLSYSGGTNSQLVNAFHATITAHATSPAGVTLRQFAEGVRRRVSSSTPQYFAKPETLYNETLFTSAALQAYLSAHAAATHD